MGLKKGIADETPSEELEVEAASAQDYQDRILVYKTQTTRLIQKTHDSENVQVSSGTAQARNRKTLYQNLVPVWNRSQQWQSV